MRVLSARATICWGVIGALGLGVPVIDSLGAQDGQPVPAPPASVSPAAATPPQPPPSPRALLATSFEVAWTHQISETSDLSVQLSSRHAWVSGPTFGVEARSVADGSVVWNARARLDSPVTVTSDLVIAAADGGLAAWDQVTGRLRWTVPAIARTRRPVATDGVLVVAGETSAVAYRTTDGARLWQHDVPAGLLADPLILPDAVILATSGAILSLDSASGAVRWTQPMDVTPTALSAGGDHLYVGIASGGFCSYERTSGRFRWCFPIRIPTVGAPLLVKNTLFVSFLDNAVRQFDAGSGARLQNIALGARPALAPAATSTSWVVPLVNGQLFLGSLTDPRVTAKISPPNFESTPTLQASAVDAAVKHVAVLTASPTSRALTLFRAK